MLIMDPPIRPGEERVDTLMVASTRKRGRPKARVWHRIKTVVRQVLNELRLAWHPKL